MSLAFFHFIELKLFPSHFTSIVFFPCSADLQKAIESEDYALAAGIRDQISKLEAESLAASAKALAFENAQYAFRLGQKMKHKIFGIEVRSWCVIYIVFLTAFCYSESLALVSGYEAVICGMDPACSETSSWMEMAQVDKLSRGPNQPFYQVY